MTNLVNKSHLLGTLNQLKNALELMANMNAAVDAACNNTRCQDMENGARRVLDNLTLGLTDGCYDATLEDVLDEAGITIYTEAEDLDTEDMDDEAPEEEPLIPGIIMLPPCPSPKEMAELVRWYNSMGWGIIEL